MNKDVIVAVYEERPEFDDFHYIEIERLDSYVPYGFISIDDWIDGRRIAKHRVSIEKLMRELGMVTRHDFISMARCLSLTDTFWMKRADEELSWSDVSLYKNPFDDVIARIAFDGTGMFGRRNSPTSPEYATSGSFAKCWVREEDGIYLLKRGSTGFENAGFEPYSEVLATQILQAAHSNHVPYTVVMYHNKLASKCPIFTSEDIGFVSAHRFFERPFSTLDMLQFASNCDAEEQFREMVVMDAVMANVDRHAGNYGFLVDNAKGTVLGMVPLFDHNMACLPMMMENDNLHDYLYTIGPKIGNSFIGIARELVTSEIKAKLITLKNFEFTDPGFGYPQWKLNTLNHLKDYQIQEILA